jgi:hypothetical protein
MTLTIDFTKLNNVPYMRDYANNLKYQNWVNEYIDFWSKQTPEGLESVALIRAIECTNGCVQYAFRDEEPWALDLEQTRLCMKTSMTFIKTKKLDMPDGSVIECDPSIIDALNKIRDIYIRGFKQGDDEAQTEFYAQSIAQFIVIGREKINEKFDWVCEHFTDVFSELFLRAGRHYVLSYLDAVGV